MKLWAPDHPRGCAIWLLDGRIFCVPCDPTGIEIPKEFRCAAIAGGRIPVTEAHESTHFRWRVAIPGRDPFEVRVVPEATAAQMQLQYPGATIEPLSDPPSRPATQAEAAELRSLIRIVAERDAWPADEIEEAIAVALGDADAAIVCWRELASQDGLVPPTPDRDDRRTCLECLNLDRHAGRDGFRRCGAARRGELPYVAQRDYSPIVDLPKRCEGFAPMPDDEDQRLGRERWPALSPKDEQPGGHGMNGLFLGVDVGLSGAIALVDGDGRLVIVEDMPLSARGHGRVRHEVDAAGLLHVLRPHAPDIAFGIVERVSARPGQGVASMFSLGHSSGVIAGILAALHIPHETMSAAKWKGLAELPPEKGLVLAAARRRWPEAPLPLVKHHGRAESLFLALLAMRRNRRV